MNHRVFARVNAVVGEHVWSFARDRSPKAAAQLLRRAKECAASYQDTLSQMPVALTQMCCSLYLLAAGAPLHPRIQ